MMSDSGALDHRAQRGFAKSAAYDQHRPAYPDKIVQLLLEKLGLDGKTGAQVLDLAAGTGKFTTLLAQRPEQYDVTAVEPHNDMRRILEEKKLHGVVVKEGRADSIPLDDESVDAVICAQSFHWFANMEALREIYRVMKPHSVLGMIWNIEDYNSPKDFTIPAQWESELHDVVWSLPEDGQPRFRNEKWRKVFDEQINSSPLSLIIASGDQLFSLPLSEDQETFEHRLSKDSIWERMSTLSQITNLEDDARERVHKKVMDILNKPDNKRDADGKLLLHGTTYAAWSTKIPPEGRENLTDVERP